MKGEIWWGEEVEKGLESRISKDREVNGEGRRLCSFLGERGWGIMNGNVEGVEGGGGMDIHRRKREFGH